MNISPESYHLGMILILDMQELLLGVSESRLIYNDLFGFKALYIWVGPEKQLFASCLLYLKCERPCPKKEIDFKHYD